MATEVQGYRNIKAHGYRGTRLYVILRHIATELHSYRNTRETWLQRYKAIGILRHIDYRATML